MLYHKFLKCTVLVSVIFSVNATVAQTLGAEIHYPYNELLKGETNVNSPYKLTDESFEYSYCDADGDGFMTIPLDDIIQEVVSQTGITANDNAAILIGTEWGKLIKVNNPGLSISSIELLCSEPIGLSDVALDENMSIYTCSFDAIKKKNANNCNSTPVLNFDFGVGINSLSFDVNGNLYYGMGTESNVYRYDADEAGPAYVWHNFVEGYAAGDFVMLGDKLYIAWHINSEDRLYEVTVDSNIDYVSHIDKGIIKIGTYGLASELGILYGVTPEVLYSIDTENMATQDVLNNDGTYGDWWGAAGFHEAIGVVATAHTSHANAASGQNPISGNWINEVQGGQTIYVRIENTNTGEYIIVPVVLHIYATPQLTTPNDLTRCASESMQPFHLSDVKDELLQNVNHAVTVHYYTSAYDASIDQNEISDIHDPQLDDLQVIVKVKNITGGCYAQTTFRLITYRANLLEPMVHNYRERSLESCYIDENENGYFKLSEIYDSVVLPGVTEPVTLYFYASYNNAKHDIDPLADIYYLPLGATAEIFVKAVDENGCENITNFFVDGDCVKYSPDLTNIHFPKFFTPNNDGVNDFWNVTGISEAMKNSSKISILDRFGRVMYVFYPGKVPGWDGYYNNVMALSNDYWYLMETPVGKTYRGHFSLIR